MKRTDHETRSYEVQTESASSMSINIKRHLLIGRTTRRHSASQQIRNRLLTALLMAGWEFVSRNPGEAVNQYRQWPKLVQTPAQYDFMFLARSAQLSPVSCSRSKPRHAMHQHSCTPHGEKLPPECVPLPKVRVRSTHVVGQIPDLERRDTIGGTEAARDCETE